MDNKKLIELMEGYVENIPQAGVIETYEIIGMKKLIKFAKSQIEPKIVIVTNAGTKYYDTFEEVPYPITGYTEDQSEIRAKGGFTCNEILDNKPMFKGLIGPMLDGNKFRYETPEIYDMLSR